MSQKKVELFIFANTTVHR